MACSRSASIPASHGSGGSRAAAGDAAGSGPLALLGLAQLGCVVVARGGQVGSHALVDQLDQLRAEAERALEGSFVEVLRRVRLLVPVRGVVERVEAGDG